MTWKNFTLDEFKCRHCGANKMDHEFIDKLQRLRDAVGFPLHINSGYRCPEYNKEVSTTGEAGPHTTGRAVDISVSRLMALDLFKEAVAQNEFTGFGFKQHGWSRFVHLDDLKLPYIRPTIWTYP